MKGRSTDRYFIREGDQEPREVDLEEWIKYESRAGMRPTTPGRPSTEGFMHMRYDEKVFGAVAQTHEEVESVLDRLKKF